MSLLPSRGPDTSTAQEGELQVVGVDEEVAPVFDALSSDTAREVLNAIYEDPGTPSEIASRLDMSIQKVSYHLENLADVDLITVAGTRYSEKGQEMTVYEPPDEPLVLFVGTEERKRTLRSLVKRVVPTLGVLALASAVVQTAFGGGLDLGFGAGSGSPSYAERASGGDGSGEGGTRTPASGGDGSGGGGTRTPASGGEQGATDAVGIAAEDAGPTAGAATSQDTSAATETAQPTGVRAATDTPAPESVGTAGGGADGGVAASEAAATPTDVAEELARPPDTVVDSVAALEPGLAFFLGGVFVLGVVGIVWYASAR